MNYYTLGENPLSLTTTRDTIEAANAPIIPGIPISQKHLPLIAVGVGTLALTAIYLRRRNRKRKRK